MISPHTAHHWLTTIAHAPTWTGWHTMKRLATNTGYWQP